MLATLAIAFAVVKNDVSTIDGLRQQLLQLEKELENDLTSPKWTNLETREKCLHLIKAYKMFGNNLDQQFPLDREDYLRSLDLLWLWARTQSESKGINGLYMVFRQMQREIVNMNAPINVKQLVNFAETILRDPNASIPRAIDRIANLIVEGKLFIVAFQVST